MCYWSEHQNTKFKLLHLTVLRSLTHSQCFYLNSPIQELSVMVSTFTLIGSRIIWNTYPWIYPRNIILNRLIKMWKPSLNVTPWAWFLDKIKGDSMLTLEFISFCFLTVCGNNLIFPQSSAAVLAIRDGLCCQIPSQINSGHRHKTSNCHALSMDYLKYWDHSRPCRACISAQQ